MTHILDGIDTEFHQLYLEIKTSLFHLVHHMWEGCATGIKRVSLVANGPQHSQGDWGRF